MQMDPYKSQGVTEWFDKYESGVIHRAGIIGGRVQGYSWDTHTVVYLIFVYV